MKDKLKAASERTLVRYVVIGGTSYALELGLLLAMMYMLGISRTIATGIAYWIGLFVTFMLQKLIAFRDYSKEKKQLGKQGVIYGMLVAFNYIFTIIVVGAFSEHLVIVSRTVALVITTGWNYIIYKKFIFKNSVKNPV